MQALREEQQSNARERREVLNKLNDEYRQQTVDLQEKHRQRVREIQENTAMQQQDVERRMNDLKKAWYAEHPYQEVQVM